MSIEATIYNLITGDEAIAALITSRLYPLSLPQGASLPAVVTHHETEDEDLAADGALGLIEAAFRFDCWAASHLEAVELASALRAALQDYSGTISGIKIHHVMILSRGDLPALNVEAEQLSRYGKFLDVQFSYETIF